MRKVMRCGLAGAALLLGVGFPRAAPAEDEAEAARALRAWGQRLEALIEGTYPDGDQAGSVFAVQGDALLAERRARTFQVHLMTKDGRWQDALERRGPQWDGFVVEARVRRGPYVAARAIGPVDQHYYVEHRMVHHDEASDLHLVLDLRVPPERLRLPWRRNDPGPEGFVKAVAGLVSEFRAAP